MSIEIRSRVSKDDAWVRETLSSVWGTPFVVSRGRGHQADQLPGLVAVEGGERVGLLTVHIEGDALEVVTIHALRPRRGVGSALLREVSVLAKSANCVRTWLVTTNDNRAAIAFYQSVGMRLVAIHRGALAESRLLKPEIPTHSREGVAIEDELEFELDWTPGFTGRPG